MSIIAAEDFSESLTGVVGTARSLETLQIARSPWLTQIEPIEQLSGLGGVSFQGCSNLADISMLSKLASLQAVHLDDCPMVGDVSPLAAIEDLVELRIIDTMPGIDLSAFANHKDLTIWLGMDQDVRGADALKSGVVINRVPTGK